MSRVKHDEISATLLPGFAGTTLPDWLADRLANGLGGVCVFGPNITDAAQLRALTDDVRRANPAAIVAIDEEGGDVTRLHYRAGSPYPGNAVLGRLDDTELTSRVAAAVGEDLRRVGCTLDFAPSVDVNSNPLNPVIGVRSFGSVGAAVARHSAAWVRGLQSSGIGACAKHFPGHGDVATDSHLGLPVLDVDRERLRDQELVPFAAAIAAGASAVMTSHILLPQVDPDAPATMSRPVLQGILREELGFDGLIVSDALDMAGASGEIGIPEAAVRALHAGVDLLCIGTNNSAEQMAQIEQAIADAVESGRLPAERVSEAARRVAEYSARQVDPASDDVEGPTDTTGCPSVLGAVDVGRAFEIEADPGLLAQARTPAAVVRLDATANIAVGVAPWGPFTLEDPWPGVPILGYDVREDAPPTIDLVETLKHEADGGVVLAIGKGNHRYAKSRALIDSLREAGVRLVTIDMGWPSDDRSYAEIATFGASRLVGRELMRVLEEHAS